MTLQEQLDKVEEKIAEETFSEKHNASNCSLLFSEKNRILSEMEYGNLEEYRAGKHQL